MSTAILSDAEIAFYRAKGWLVPRYRLPAADLAKLQAMSARLIADNPHVHNDPFTNMHVPSYAVQKLKIADDWLEVSAHPGVLDILEQLIGPDIILWATALFHKEPVVGGRTHFHRDAVYYPINPLVAPNVWIALTPSTLENGCVQFIPGSHLSQERGRHSFTDGKGVDLVTNKIDDDEFDISHAVPVELEPGEMYISDVFVIHGGGPNLSPDPRTGFSLRYMPATSVYEHSVAPGHAATSDYNDFKSRPLHLVRGIDRSGKNDFSIGHPVPNGGLSLMR